MSSSFHNKTIMSWQSGYGVYLTTLAVWDVGVLHHFSYLYSLPVKGSFNIDLPKSRKQDRCSGLDKAHISFLCACACACAYSWEKTETNSLSSLCQYVFQMKYIDKLLKREFCLSIMLKVTHRIPVGMGILYSFS